ncbi:hypothetical protein E3N88_40392 [Mikania micrantha]|uniref:Transmembrane 9 superfamily member n=1 Tax=Mikania micrantha TaxID=192012 RepID=A0A5N6LML6_9ASTR|nr:hypothetical protein E3N88_40392 [Mikania micrantha]
MAEKFHFHINDSTSSHLKPPFACSSQLSHVNSEAFDHHYNSGDVVPIYANKAFPYPNLGDDFPFCSQDAKARVDKMLNENHLVLTPYKFEFLEDKQFELLCKKTFSKTYVSKLRSVIEDGYRMLLYHEDMPIWALVGTVDMDHRDKTIKTEYFLYNHYDFEFVYHNDTVIDVIVLVDSSYMVNVTEDVEADVEFTYSVRWFVTQDPYDKRMKTYINYSNVPPHNFAVGYSIANSSFTILILIVCLLIFYIRVLRKDISKYACDVEEAEMADNQEHTGWKNIHGDVFRFPKYKSLFAAAIGSGTQLLVIMIAILILGVTDVCQLYLPRVFMNVLASIYALTCVISGYTSTSFYHQLEGTRWTGNLLLTVGLYLGPLFLTFVVNNTVAVLYGSTTALPSGETVKLSLFWILLALLLFILGAFFGKKKVLDFQAPCRTTKCPKEVPKLHWYRGVLPQMALAGFLPFSVIILQIYDILNAVSGYKIYTSYDSMLIMLFLILIMTALVSVVMTYFQLSAEDHEWWWRSFLCGGSTGLYVFAYSIYYSLHLTEMNDLTQTMFFFGYMACLGYGIFLALGTVGFYASLMFVRYLYASIKCD